MANPQDQPESREDHWSHNEPRHELPRAGGHFPVQSAPLPPHLPDEDDTPPGGLWEMLAARCPVELGWRLTFVLVGLLAAHLFNLISTPLNFFYLANIGQILFSIAVIAMLFARRWGFNTYVAVMILYVLFCWVPQFDPLRFAFQVLLFVALLVAIIPRLEDLL